MCLCVFYVCICVCWCFCTVVYAYFADQIKNYVIKIKEQRFTIEKEHGNVFFGRSLLLKFNPPTPLCFCLQIQYYIMFFIQFISLYHFYVSFYSHILIISTRQQTTPTTNTHCFHNIIIKYYNNNKESEWEREQENMGDGGGGKRLQGFLVLISFF